MAEAGATEWILLGSFATALAILVNPRLRHSPKWGAMVTPLASIIGSGFLVSVPLLASRLGIWSVVAICGLCLLAWFIGGAIRFNIAHAEPLCTVGGRDVLNRVERGSHLVLAAAYFVSVTYYLALLGAFVVKLTGADWPVMGTMIASAFVIGICAMGITRGLSGVERAEKLTVAMNLSAILALLVTLLWRDGHLASAAWHSVPVTTAYAAGDQLRFLMGLLIVVQGFETTRFTGDMYDAPARIRAMKRAQILSSLIYVVFFTLMIPLYGQFQEETDVAGFIGVIGVVSPLLPLLMVMGAVASQFSAAVADSIGSSELVTDLLRGRMGQAAAYWLIGGVALSLLWLTDVTAIVALASRAFALFYALQCGVATIVAHRRGQMARSAWYGILGLACAATAIFGLPAEG